MLFTLTPSPRCFRWTGENDFILRCNDQELIVGSGGGCVDLLSFHSHVNMMLNHLYRSFGLWLDNELDKGYSSSCTAFNNTPLTGRDEPHSQFNCATVEVYSCG